MNHENACIEIDGRQFRLLRQRRPDAEHQADENRSANVYRRLPATAGYALHRFMLAPKQKKDHARADPCASRRRISEFGRIAVFALPDFSAFA
ncbi:MAG: hypothetical protein ACYC7B_01980 [Burkholderiales bacterium]